MSGVPHKCHWPGCEQYVSPELWGCLEHWGRLPAQLRDAILREYRPGQEVRKEPSLRYIVLARIVQGWIKGTVTIHPDGSMTSSAPDLQRHLSANK